MRPTLLTQTSPAMTDTAYLVVRVMMGVIFINASLGDFEMGFPTLVENYEGAGIPLAALATRYAAFGQLAFGVLLIVGALTRAASAGLIVVMLGAVWFVHRAEGLDGFGYPLMLAVACTALILTGPGRYSVDHAVLTRRERTAVAPFAERAH